MSEKGREQMCKDMGRADKYDHISLQEGLRLNISFLSLTLFFLNF